MRPVVAALLLLACDRPAAPRPAKALLVDDRVEVTLCDGSAYVVEGDVVFFPNADRVPSYNTYEGDAAAARAAARRLRWKHKKAMEFSCE